ncbi:MAG: peptidoglycan editing factor PgeF [Candidatus Saganbacteria bacterium]|nr:peptidoglycan editing factor PgeF [Candidatus Saganbacteria bacterium]
MKIILDFKILKNTLNVISTREFKDLPSFLTTLNLKETEVVQAEQVHGENRCWVKGLDAGKTIPGVDALITKEKNLPIIVRTADCVPILIYDPVKSIIAVVHSGWKGTLLRIVQKTIENIGSDPADLKIGIGPAIGKCCYEVGEEVISKLKKEFGGWEKYLNGKKLDLVSLNKDQLLELGVKEENIEIKEMCTACNNDIFYSYRKDGPTTGRIYSLLMNINEPERFSYNRPVIIDIKKQQSASLAQCAFGLDVAFPSCSDGIGNTFSCDAVGTNYGGRVCIAHGEATTSGSTCDNGGGGILPS